MTPKTISHTTVLQAISEESLGFKFGKPDRPNESSLACILPILRETSQERQYVTLPETDRVIVTDSGIINKVNLKNTGDKNVFLRSGTIFEGKGTQSRALTRSAVLFPKTEVALDARCVHASHSIRTGSEFKYGGITPISVDSALYASGYRPRDQQTMWASVREASTHMSQLSRAESAREVRQSFPVTRERVRPVEADARRIQARAIGTLRLDSAFVSAGNDNLKANFDAFARDFDHILSKARLHENQVGLALITESGCKTVELFDVPVSWEALHKDAVKRMGTELLRGPDESNVFEYKPEHAANAVRKVLALDYNFNTIYEHKPSDGEPHVAIFGLTASRYVGEIVELDGRVIHLVLLEAAAA